MRLKEPNAAVRVCALASFVVLAATALTAAPALALPEGRHYEMVSPLYKGSYGASEIKAVSPDGSRVAYFSLGGFAKAPGGPGGYVAQRGASGWTTSSLQPPALMAPYSVWGNFDFSSTLESVLTSSVLGPNAGWAEFEGAEDQFLVHSVFTPDTEANWEVAGRITLKALEKTRVYVPSDAGASPDLCHILLEEGNPLLEVAKEAKGNTQLYDLSRGCAGSEPSLRFVSLDNRGEARPIDPHCAARIGNGEWGVSSAFNAVAADGGEVFFTTSVEKGSSSCKAHQLFVRLDGSRTVEVSRTPEAGQPFGGCGDGGKPGEVPGEVPCAGADARVGAQFAGANELGTIVFFTTSESSQSAEPSDLYMARLGCPGEAASCALSEREVTSMTHVAVPVTVGEAAGVQGVVRVAPDGSRVYYVATGVMSERANSERQLPVKGADNLYVYDASTDTTSFVADLCSDAERSGSVHDVRCPAGLDNGRLNDSNLWLVPTEAEAQTAGPDGRFLAFSSYGRLTVDDTDTAKDVYRYDAATGELTRVSVGEEGADVNGNNNAFDAHIAFGHPGGRVFEQYEMNSRAISEDGSRIAFTTAEPLSERATNGFSNVYEWRREPGWSEGRVSMISCGCSPEADNRVVISPFGKDVFFTTAAGLVPLDTDGVVDVYDAHECSASAPCFPPPPGEAEPCEVEGCYGPLTNPAPLLVSGSVVQAPDGNLPPPKKATPKKLTRAQQLARALKACRKKPKKQRASCERGARKRYAKAARSARGGHR
jgi:hypothetical protein